MLDLGFLEDVERILALTPSSRQTALFSATMPPEIRRLADQYLYDPVTVKVKTATLTVDTVEQFALEVAPQEKADRAGRGARGRAARAGDRVRAHQDPLRPAVPHAARPGHERQGAARRHDPGLARRRDDLVQGRPPAAAGRHRRRRPRPRHLRRLARHQLRRPDLARRLRAPDRADRPRRAQRPRDHLLRAPPAARDRGDRAPRRGRSCRRGSRTPTSRPTPVDAEAAAPLQAARAVERRRPGAQADRLRRPRRGPRALRHHPRDHRPPPASTARPCATSACSSASPSSRSRTARPSAWSTDVSGTEVRGHTLRARGRARARLSEPCPQPT